MNHVVILVPGIMGSRLSLKLPNGELDEVWPGPVKSLLLPYRRMADLLKWDLVPTDCIRSYFVSEQYGHLIKRLTTWGFDESQGTLMIAAYDWRKSNELSASTLAAVIQAAAERFGDQLSISLIAHSMGGLVSRYYLESGRFNDSKGYAAVKQLIFLGTPQWGAPVALPVAMGQEKRLWLDKKQTAQLANDPQYPAVYELMPHQDEPFLWQRAGTPAAQPLDPYSPPLSTALGLNAGSLATATRLHQVLAHATRPAGVRYFSFVGTQLSTATHVSCTKATHAADKVMLDDGGDGTVPTWSGLLPKVQRLFVPGEHGEIYKSRLLLSTLAGLLGKEAFARGVPDETRVFLSAEVVEPDAVLQAVVSFGRLVADFSGWFTIDAMQFDTGYREVLGYGPRTTEETVTYRGADLNALTIVFKAPLVPGVYRVAFWDELTDAEPKGQAQLVVQGSE